MTAVSEEAHRHWRAHGYALVRVLDDDQLAAALDNVHDYMPSWEDYARAPRRYEAFLATARGTLGPYRAFPFAGDGLNAVSVHPDLVAFAEKVIGTRRLMLSHSALIGKYAGSRDFDQSLHVDYGNNTLVCPKPDDQIFDLPCITYYSEVTVELGPTHLVPQEHTRGGPLEPRSRSREEFPELYEHEVAVTVPAGWTLIYSMNTFHRGSAMRAAEGVRFSHHMGFRRADMTWCGQQTFQHEGGRPEMDHFLETATPRQRELVGFPPAGDPWWDEGTLAGVAARYPGIDMSPYRRGVTGGAP